MPNQPDNHFYWSGNGLHQNTAFSRTFDLSAVSSATLTFDAWHQLADGWNYGYVSVSDDAGKTFKPLVSNVTKVLSALPLPDQYTASRLRTTPLAQVVRADPSVKIGVLRT